MMNNDIVIPCTTFVLAVSINSDVIPRVALLAMNIILGVIYSLLYNGKVGSRQMQLE